MTSPNPAVGYPASGRVTCSTDYITLVTAKISPKSIYSRKDPLRSALLSLRSRQLPTLTLSAQPGYRSYPPDLADPFLDGASTSPVISPTLASTSPTSDGPFGVATISVSGTVFSAFHPGGISFGSDSDLAACNIINRCSPPSSPVSSG